MSVIEATGLTKRFGQTIAVNDVSFAVRPGEVTGFLGRNGAGKTTTLRMILGLEHPSSGTVTIEGRAYARLDDPLRRVGSLLDARAVQPSASAGSHLLALARSNGIGRHRVGEVLGAVGLGGLEQQKASTFSLGMLQRLGLAAALLGDPDILVLDEPLNGLDPEGIIWFRGLMRQLAAEGRTVLISSHLMSEMSVTADRLLIIGEGRLLVDSDMAAFQRDHEDEEVRVRAADPQALRDRIIAAGGIVRDLDATAFAVQGLDGPAIGALAFQGGIQLNELAPTRRSLEDAFMELTAPRHGGMTVPASVPLAPSTPVVPITSTAEPTVASDGDAAPRRASVRFRDDLGSELIKFCSTLPRPLIVTGTLVAGIGSGVLFGNSTGQRYAGLTDEEQRSFDPTYVSLRGRSLVQVTLGIVGALAASSEYGAGTIVPSLTAVPERGRLFAAKALVSTAIGLATGLATNTGAFWLGQAMLKRHGAPSDSFCTPGAVRAVLGGSLHLAASTLLGLGIGTLTRSTAGSVSMIFAAELLVPGLAPSFPKPVPDLLTTYWLTEAGASVFMSRPDPKYLAPWVGLGVTTASSIAVLGAALTAFRKRDV